MLRLLVSLAGALLMLADAGAQAPSAPLSDAEIGQVLRQRIDIERRGVGIVVGLITPQGRRVIAHGHRAPGDPRPLDGDTLFEIGSVTKVFTALLLTDMAGRGEVALNDPVAEYLPADVTMPQRAGRSITLQDLATHMSGLPRLPDNMQPRDPANPYADYAIEQLYQFLSGHALARDIGAQYEYSNLGFGLLGHALARRAGTDYEALVADRITRPLGMGSTRLVLPPDMRARLAAGHDEKLEPAANWDLPTLAGAGGLRSSVNDMLTFLSIFLDDNGSPLARAAAALLSVRTPTGVPNLDIALGWHVSTGRGREFVWHSGGTGGYRSFVAYLPQQRLGVAVLTNTTIPPDDIAQHIVDPRQPLLPPPKQRTAIAVDSKILDNYLGRYRLAPNFVLTVTREGAQLAVQATGQARYPVYPESEREYFVKDFDAQITFETGADGRAFRLILHQAGRDMPAPRID